MGDELLGEESNGQKRDRELHKGVFKHLFVWRSQLGRLAFNRVTVCTE